jgi:hypothetical protein
VPYLPATTDRARMALAANEHARDRGLGGRGVNRLAFGSWLNPLPPETVVDVVDALVTDASSSDAFAVEAGMFAVFTYLDDVAGLESPTSATSRRFEASTASWWCRTRIPASFDAPLRVSRVTAAPA